MRLLRLDTTGRIIETKPPDEHLVGRPVLDLVVPEERNRAQELLHAGRHGDPAWAELHLALENGLQRYLVASVPGDSGTISWSLRPAKESAEQRFEDESQIEHWLGRFLIEQIEIAVLAFDKSLTLRYRNGQVAKVLPLQNAELPLGTSFEALARSLATVVREPQGLIETLHHAVLANSPLRQVECLLHDGRTLELDYLPVLQNPGSVAHVLRLRDISGRRLLERRAEVAEARYHELVELLPIIVYRAPVDAIAETSYVSRQIHDLLGYTAEEWVSQRGMWARHLHPDDRERVVSAIERALVEHGSFALEYRMVHRDGRVVWVQDWGRVHHDERGHRWIYGALLDVTGLKQAEQARFEAEQRLTALIEALPAVVCSVEATPVRDAAGVPYYPIRYVNEYFTTLTGFPVEALREDPSLYARLIHPDDRAIYTAECLRTGETGEPFNLQYRLIRSDGSVIWVHERAVPLRDNDGTILAWQCVIVDVTRQKEIEQALREAEARYRTLVEQLPGVVLVRPLLDGKEKFFAHQPNQYVSSAIRQLTGYAPEEWDTRRFVESLHPDDRERVVAAVLAADRALEPLDIEFRLRRADGTTVWVWSTSRVVTSEEGEPLFRHVLLMDISDRKCVEQALREAEARYRTLVEQLPGAVILRSHSSRQLPDGSLSYDLFYVSPSIEQLTGLSVAEWQEPGRWSRQVHPDDRDRVLAALLESERTGSPLDLEYRFIRKDGVVIWLWHVTHVLLDASGKPWQRQVLLMDITERKQAELALREAEARYRALVEQLPGAVLIRSAFSEVQDDGQRRYTLYYVSPGIERVTGFTPEEWLVPGTWTRQMHPDDRDWVLAAVLRSEEELTPLDIEYRLYRKDGRLVWIWHLTRVIRAEDGTPRYRQVLLLDITTRKLAEEALRSAEAHYRTLVEQLPAAVIQVAPYAEQLPDGNPGYETRYVSPQIEAITGFTPEEWREPGIWARHIDPEDRARVLQAFWRQEETGEPLELEYRFRRKDGTVVWLWHEVRTIRAPDGAIEARQAVIMDVTARKQAEQDLREAEARFRSLVEQLPGALLVLEPGTVWRADKLPVYRTIYVSPRILDLTGYTPDEWAEFGFLVRSVHPDDRAYVLEALQPFERTGKPLRLEYRFVRRDGRMVWHRLETWPVWRTTGEITAWYALLLDVTVEKEAERALREAEERYRNLVEQLPAVVYVEGVAPVPYPDGRVDRPLLYVSPQIRELTGYTAEEHQQNRSLWIQAIHPEDYPRVRQEMRAAWSSGRFQSEFRIIRRDGVIRWLESTARLIRDAEGQPLYWQGVMLDVTARKEIEQALREAEERYRALVEQIPAAVIVTAASPVALPDGGLHYPIIYLSQRIEEVTGFSREEFEAVPGLWFTRMHPDDQTPVYQEAVRTDETGEPFTVVYRFQRKDGRWVWLENRAVMIRDLSGQPLFWHGLLIDVSERKRAEELLVAQTRLLRMIAEAAPLSEILDQLARLVEEQEPALLCSILILDEQGRLYHGAAPSLPPAYVTAIDGLRIGPNVGSCGTAAFLNQPIFVEDTSTDPRWADFRELAERFGLRACWSTPIRDQNGVVLGTVALSARAPRGPRREEQQLLDFATQLAALALERWRETEELRYRASHDPLTGLANRLLFLDRLEHARARASRDGSGLAVLFVDLDDFKEINDTWGHSAGDLVLQEVAERLAQSVRSGDTVARFAGDEFTVLLEGVSTPEEVAAIAQRLMDSTVEPIELGETTVHAGCSVGAALAVGRHLPDSSSMLLAADQALYAAKRRGKSCFELVVVRGEANHGLASPVSPDAEERGTA